MFFGALESFKTDFTILLCPEISKGFKRPFSPSTEFTSKTVDIRQYIGISQWRNIPWSSKRKLNIVFLLLGYLSRLKNEEDYALN